MQIIKSWWSWENKWAENEVRNNVEFLSDRVSELDIDLEACLVCACVRDGEGCGWLWIPTGEVPYSPNHPVWEQGWGESRTQAISFSRRIWPTPFVTWSLQFARRKLLKLVTAATRSSKKEEDGRRESGRLIKANLSLRLFPKGDRVGAFFFHGYCSLTSLYQTVSLGQTFATID